MNAARLAGKTVVVTRALEDAGPLSAALEALGAAVCVAPGIEVRPCCDNAEVAAALAELPGTGWIAFASKNGVRCLAALLKRVELRLPPRIRFAAVGPGTAAEIEEHFASVDLVAKENTAEGLATAMLVVCRPADGGVLLPAARKGRNVLEEMLSEGGFRVRRLPVYETVPGTRADGPLAVPAEADYVLFTSPSTVRGYLARASVPTGARVVSIGPTTTSAVREAGLTLWREARAHNLDGLLEVLE